MRWGAVAVEVIKLDLTKHLTDVAVFDDLKALGHQHLWKTQGFAGKGTVAIGSGVLGVKDADQV
jgi:hypothetical protein